MSTLELCDPAVHHKLGVLAGEDYQPVAPLRVSQNATYKTVLYKYKRAA